MCICAQGIKKFHLDSDKIGMLGNSAFNKLANFWAHPIPDHLVRGSPWGNSTTGTTE